MNTFRVTYTDGTGYLTSANGTAEEFKAYLMQYGGIVTVEQLQKDGEESQAMLTDEVADLDGGKIPPQTLICGWCGNHREGYVKDGVACSCGGNSWLVCTLGCLEHEKTHRR